MATDEITKRKVDAILEQLGKSRPNAAQEFSDFKASAPGSDIANHDSRLRSLLTQLRLELRERNPIAQEEIT